MWWYCVCSSQSTSCKVYLHIFIGKTWSNLLFLTRSVPGYDIFVVGNWPKTRNFRLPCQQQSSSADCAGELFKPSKDLASLRVCNEKRFWGLSFFVSDVISEVGFWPFWLILPGLGPNCTKPMVQQFITTVLKKLANLTTMRYRSAIYVTCIWSFAVSCCTIGFTSSLSYYMKMIDSLIGKRTGNKCHWKWYSQKLDLKALTRLIAEEMELVKWRSQIDVEDKDLSFINICFHHYCNLLKRYYTTCSWSCTGTFLAFMTQRKQRSREVVKFHRMVKALQKNLHPLFLHQICVSLAERN